MTDVETQTELWGGETRKAVANFTVSGEPIPASVARWLGRIKGAAARVNADLGLLDASDYPPALKARIAGRFGHLCNDDAAALLSRLDNSRLKHIVAAHLSQHNNTPQMARAALAGALGCAVDWIGLADQAEGFGWRALN